MENKNTTYLTEAETLMVHSDFFGALFPMVSEYVKENQIEVTYNKKLNRYSVSMKKEETVIPVFELMNIAKNTVNKNHKIYKKLVANSNKSNIIFNKLLAQKTYYEEGAIRQQFSRKSFTDEILEGVSELLNVDTNIINGTNPKAIISMTYQFHNCDMEEYYSNIDEHYNMESQEYELWKFEFITAYEELSTNEKYALYNNFDLIKNAFSFFNYKYEIFDALNKKGQDAYNDVFGALFPDKLVESRLAELDNTANNSTEYAKTKHLIEQADTITEKDIKNLPLKKAKEVITDNINKCAPVYYDIILENVKLLLDTSNDNRKIALFFTTLSENEKTMITSILFHLKSNPEYTA